MSDQTRHFGAIGGQQAPAASGGGDLTDHLINTSVWTDADLANAGIPVQDIAIVSIGGGLGSLALVEFLRSAGMSTDRIRVLGDNAIPYATYEYLARNSQIPRHERLRSDSGSVMDNIWGFPSYALREAVQDKSFKPLWNVATEPIFADYYTPKAGQVYESVEREIARLGWNEMLRLGYARMVRKRAGGGYFVVQTPEPRGTGPKRVAYRTNFVHIAIGYPGVAFLPDLQEYRERTGDYTRVVNSYEPHDHVYEECQRRPCTVLVRGNGIVGSRILQRLIDDIDAGAQTRIVHLFRNYVDSPQGDKATFRRPGANGFAYQGFNFAKAAWGGQYRFKMERLEGEERRVFLDSMGGTNTAPRRSWKEQIARGRRDGFYSQAIGEVESVDPSPDGSGITTTIRSKSGDVHTIDAQFIIDGTGLLARLDDHRLMADLLTHSGVGKNPKGRLDVERHFEIRGTANGEGRMYASGAMTLGGYYAGVDSFLGLQYAALRIADDLAAQGLCKKIGTARSVSQWWKWMRNKTP
jgi:hypothetical protein